MGQLLDRYGSGRDALMEKRAGARQSNRDAAGRLYKLNPVVDP
jgi:hypothetical protein